MRHDLVILNYQREIPPFMQTLIHYANEVFDNIYYFTPKLYNDNREACYASKLKVIECSRWIWRKALFTSLFCFLTSDVIQQIKIAKKHKVKLLPVIKQIYVQKVCSRPLSKEVNIYINKGIIKPDNTTILAVWFSSEAYAAAELKRKYPKFKTVSYAHSFEISTAKNPFMAYNMNIPKHTCCDNIIFISNILKSLYCREIDKLYPSISLNNIEVRYLGSKKNFKNSICKGSIDNRIRLLSCSGIINVKRVDLIIKSLKKWNSEYILCWTHIGDGPLANKVKELARLELANLPNVEYEFVGAYNNKEVQSFYKDKNIDLFINVSADEGIPVSIMESLSYGVPVIATDVGGTSEIVVNKKTGYLLNKDFSSEDLISCIMNYISLTNDKKLELRNSAIEMWQTNFNAEPNSLDFLRMISD